MKKILIAIFLIVANKAFSQRTLFENLKIDSGIKIVGIYDHHDTKKTCEKYNFIIEDSASIAQFIKNLKIGKEVKNSHESKNFRIAIVQNFKEKERWIINPIQKSVMTDGSHTYAFDLDQLTKLNEMYSFNYHYQTKIFSTRTEYDNYLKQQKDNPKFLFDYAPEFKYEGSFEIQFKKSKQFPTPKAISNYLEPYIENFVSKDEYTLYYILDEKNMNDDKQYTMTITGPKKIFDNLKLKGLKNENWQPIIEEGLFFYKE